jgi:hypothetical protein
MVKDAKRSFGNCFQLDVRVLLIWRFWQADLELAQKDDSLSSLSAVLG